MVLLPSSKAKFVDLLRELLHIEHPMRSGELKQLSEFRPALILAWWALAAVAMSWEGNIKVKAFVARLE